jgi:hypothetical protein
MARTAGHNSDLRPIVPNPCSETAVVNMAATTAVGPAVAGVRTP